jgi:Transposase, Mutator family/LexA-binding, inner membrane-associated putative hydrolase
VGACFYCPGTPKRVWGLGVFCSVIPDLDVIGFRFGIHYGDFWGHRGFTHSLLFAALLASAVMLGAFRHASPGLGRLPMWIYFFLATASHGFLDAMTDGGLGVAFFSPFDPMRRVIPITEQFQHFVEELQGNFWGDCYGQARRFVHEAIERESLRLREVYLNCCRYERTSERRDQRNGFYYRDFQTRFGCLRLKIARSRNRSFLPSVIQLFQRRAEDVTLLVREAFLRGISTRQVGRVIASLELGPLSAQTVSRLSRSLDSMVEAFHQCRLADEWAYLFLDGVSLRVRRPAANACKCWSLTGFVATAAASCSLSCAVRARAKPLGKVCLKISTDAAWSERIYN